MAKSSKAARWAAYNRRIATCDWYREADRLKRIETRRRKQDAQCASIEAQHEALIPAVFTAKPVHEMRVIVEIDGCKRAFRAAYVPGYGWQGHSANLICKAIRLVRAKAA